MYCRYDRLALFSCQFPQELNDRKSAETVEARGWFIKEQDRWICNQLYTYRCALSFTARYNFARLISDLRLADVLESKLVDQIIDSLVLSIDRHVKLEARSKLKGFLYSKVGEENVVLHYISTYVTEGVLRDRFCIVHQDFTAENISPFSADAVTDHIEKTCFPST